MKATITAIGRYLYLVFSWVFVAGVIYQVYLTGLAAVAKTQGWGPHIEMGHTLALPLLGMALTMYLGRLPGKVKVFTWLLFLTYILQVYVLVIFLRRSAPYLAALHPVLALVDFTIGIWLAVQALKSLRSAGASKEEAPETNNNPVLQGE